MPKRSAMKLLKLAVVAGLHMLTAKLSLLCFIPEGGSSILFMSSGVALAAVLMGGNDYLWAVFFGTLTFNLLEGHALPISTLFALGSGAAAWAGAWLTKRFGHFDTSLTSLADYLYLIGCGAFIGSAISALTGTLTLLSIGSIQPTAYPISLLHWWIGDSLGVIVITPLILTWRSSLPSLKNTKQISEALLLLSLNTLVGQAVFLGDLHNYYIASYAKSHWLFLLITWIAVRLGTRATTLALTITAIQAMLGGTQQSTGFFAQDLGDQHQLNLGIFTSVLSIVGMALACYFSERQRVLETLSEKEELFRTLIKAMPDMVWLKNPDGVYLLCNPSFEPLCGTTEEHVIGKTDSDFFNQDEANAYREYDLAATKAGKPSINKEWLTHANGQHRALYETIKTPVNTADGKLLGVLGVARDITTHTLMTEQLADERRRLADIIEATHAGTWEWNLQSGQAVFNERWANIFGYQLAELEPFTTQTWERFVHPDDLQRANALLDKHIAGGSDYYLCELRMRHKNGH